MYVTPGTDGVSILLDLDDSRRLAYGRFNLILAPVYPQLLTLFCRQTKRLWALLRSTILGGVDTNPVKKKIDFPEHHLDIQRFSAISLLHASELPRTGLGPEHLQLQHRILLLAPLWITILEYLLLAKSQRCH